MTMTARAWPSAPWGVQRPRTSQYIRTTINPGSYPMSQTSYSWWCHQCSWMRSAFLGSKLRILCPMIRKSQKKLISCNIVSKKNCFIFVCKILMAGNTHGFGPCLQGWKSALGALAVFEGMWRTFSASWRPLNFTSHLLWSSQILPVIWYTKRNLLYHLNMHSKRFQTFKTGVYCLRFHIFKLAFQQGVEFWATRIQSCPDGMWFVILASQYSKGLPKGPMAKWMVPGFFLFGNTPLYPLLYIAQFFGVKHQRPHFWWLWDMVTARTMKFTTCRLREYRHSSVFGKGRLMLRCGRDKQHTPCFKNTLVHNFLVTLVLWMCLECLLQMGKPCHKFAPLVMFRLAQRPFRLR